MPKTALQQQAEDNLRAACARLVAMHGFFAGPVLRKRWIASETVPTMGTDGKDLFYNVEWTAAQEVPTVIAALIHEACHDLGLHMFREQGRDIIVMTSSGPVKLWNIACDTQCNQVVLESGLAVPADWVQPVADSTAEAEYEKLQQQASKLPKITCGCRMLPPTDGNGNPLTGQALKDAEADAKLAAATAAELARRAGKLPAGLARLVGAALEERVLWTQIVARFVSESAHTESSWRRPNKRYLTRGIVLPSLHSPDVPDFVLACDTSGSISNDMLKTACGEMLHALATCERHGAIKLNVVWCDTEVSAQVVEYASELEPRGGGGTMFSPVFAWVNEHVPHTKGVVYLTDGYCDDFGEEPNYPVLWVLTAANDGFKPPFGEVACVL